MTKRDFISLMVAPVILFAIAADLLWLAAKLHDGAERRFAEYTVLQERVAAPGGNDRVSSGRAVWTLSRLAVASHEADAATVTVSGSLAALLLCISMFQILTVARLLRSQRRTAFQPLPEIAASGAAPIRPISSVTAVSGALSGVADHTAR
jgi:hypothetical protein